MRYNLFILGSPNSTDGALSPMAVNRAAKAIELQKARPDTVLLATGGFGRHFNISTTPHRELLHRYLLQRGALVDAATSEDFLSSNTVEDATMIIRFAASRGSERCGILTSQFHMARCRYIFECLAGRDTFDFLQAEDPSDLDLDSVSHEAAALTQLLSQGGVLVGDVLHPHVQSS
jgi:uncharacterized SAM-binding protein YcdF (DUF218 family)